VSDFSHFVQKALLDLIEATNDAILITTADDLDRPGPRIVYANPAFCTISGYTREEIIGRSPRILQGPGTCKRTLARMSVAIRAGQNCHEELLNYSKDGTPYWLDIHIVPLRNDAGKIEYFAAIERDVTDKRTEVERLERLALEDSLTGIGNRTALQGFLETLAQEPASGLETLWMLLFDLDGFKNINDTLGHIAGDQILRHFAAYVAASLRRDDFMARLGGDEFVVVLRGYTQECASALAERIVANLASMTVSGSDMIGVSVGMTAFQRNEHIETVISRADEALYRAKQEGKGRVRFQARPYAI
jgi:diguanylate cyclase (GGDEF)-like protein/PAS domain S-box-containing protein